MKARVWFGGSPPKELTWEQKQRLGEARDELLTSRVEEWESRKPKKPETPRPEEPSTIDDDAMARLLLGTGVVLAVIVILVGAGSLDFGLVTLGILGIFAFPFVIYFGFTIPWFFVEWVQDSLWKRRWRLSGWMAYEEALKPWRSEGEALREKAWGAELHDRISRALR